MPHDADRACAPLLLRHPLVRLISSPAEGSSLVSQAYIGHQRYPDHPTRSPWASPGLHKPVARSPCARSASGPVSSVALHSSFIAVGSSRAARTSLIASGARRGQASCAALPSDHQQPHWRPWRSSPRAPARLRTSILPGARRSCSTWCAIRSISDPPAEVRRQQTRCGAEAQ